MIYPKRIIIVREFKGWTHDELATRIQSATASDVQNWENGTSRPTDNQLSRLAIVTGFLRTWFQHPLGDEFKYEECSLRFHEDGYDDGMPSDDEFNPK